MTNGHEANQYDLFAAREARDAAMDRVQGNAGQDWNAAALSSIGSVSGLVTGEDIRLHVEAIIGAPHHHNAWGAVIRQAIKGGIISRTNMYRQMKTKKSHARITPVYQVVRSRASEAA